MKRKIFKETERTLIGLDMMLYIVFVTMGYLVLSVTDYLSVDPIELSSPLFYMFGFFSILVYFLNRRKGNYEYLIFGLINVVTATFVLRNTYYVDSGFILGDAILIYSIANVLNKGYHTKKLMDERNINFIPKLVVTVLLTFLGVFVVFCLNNKIEVGSLILAYYFIIFGLLSLFEPLVYILAGNATISNYLYSLLDYDKEEVGTKNKKVLKEVNKRKPVVVEKEGEIKIRKKPKKTQTTTKIKNKKTK